MQNEILKVLVAKIQAHQDALKLSDELFIGRFKKLGSVRTWRYRLIGGDRKDIRDPDAWENKWVAVLADLASRMEGGVYIPDVVYKNLPFYKAVAKRSAILDGQANDRRVAIFLAPTGCGKSVSAVVLCNEEPGTSSYFRSHPGMKEKGFAFAAAIARHIGADPGRSLAEAIDNVSAALRARPLKIHLDEFHEVGIIGWKILRTWVDETKARFMLWMYPTDYDRIIRSQSGALDEAKQLLRRAIRPIFQDYRFGVPDLDIAIYLKNRADWKDGDCKICADRIGPTVRANGNFSLLHDAMTEAEIAAADSGADLTPELVQSQLAALCDSPKRQEGK